MNVIGEARGWQRLIQNYGRIYSLGPGSFFLAVAARRGVWRKWHIIHTRVAGFGVYREDDLKFVMFCCLRRNKFDRRNHKTRACVCVKYEYGRREKSKGAWGGGSEPTVGGGEVERDFINDSVVRELTAARPPNHFSLFLPPPLPPLLEQKRPATTAATPCLYSPF